MRFSKEPLDQEELSIVRPAGKYAGDDGLCAGKYPMIGSADSFRFVIYAYRPAKAVFRAKSATIAKAERSRNPLLSRNTIFKCLIQRDLT